MRTFIILSILVLAVYCQFPTSNPANSNCTTTAKCVQTGAACNATWYCGNSAQFCDNTKANPVCTNLIAANGACNYSVNGLYCCVPGYYCGAVSNTCDAPPTSTATLPTYGKVYEGGACDSNNLCQGPLSCISSVCTRWYSVAAAGSCVSSRDCQPGNYCSGGTCTALTTAANQPGTTCTLDSDCSGAVSGTKCFCDAPNAAAGHCGFAADFYAIPAGIATNADVVAAANNLKSMAKITTAAQATSGLAAANCVLIAQFLQYNAQDNAWVGYNFFGASLNALLLGAGSGSANNCALTAPTKCTYTTTGPTTKAGSSASSVAASIFLILAALLF